MCASSKNGEMGLFRPDLDSVVRLQSDFEHKNNYPGLHHSQGGMKFATQISSLLNLLHLLTKTSYSMVHNTNNYFALQPNTGVILPHCLALETYHKDNEPLYHSFMYSLVSPLSSIYRRFLCRCRISLI